jgi:hypothetical protein
MFCIVVQSDVDVRRHFTSACKTFSAARDIKAGGETAADDAIRVAMDEMKTAKHNKKILILVTMARYQESHQLHAG